MGTLVFQATLGGAVNLNGPNIASTINFTLPSADGSSGQALVTNGSGTLSFSTFVSAAAGSNTQVQYNSSGAFAGSANLTFNGTTLTAAGLAGPFNGSVGATTPSTGAFTTLSASSTVSGSGFNSYLASPPSIGGTSPNTGNFTSLTTSSTITDNGGTANGVTYLNGSKVVTSGTVLKFDGINLTSDRSVSTVYSGTNQATWANGIVLNNSATPATGILDSIYFSNNANMQNVFGVTQNASGYGDFVWAGYSGSYSEQMRLTSTGLGIGTSSPGYKLDVSGQIRINSVNTGANPQLLIGDYTTVSNSADIYLRSTGLSRFLTGSGGTFTWGVSGGSETMRLDSSGNLGLGVTPSAWDGVFKAFDVGQAGNGISGNSGTTELTQAAYYNSGWKYSVSSTASAKYELNVGTHQWFIAPSGTAGNPISFTRAMTLDTSGRLLIGTTAASNVGNAQLGVIGGAVYDNNFSLTAQFTNDTTSAGKGVLLGFNNSSNTGIISAAYGNGSESLAFWTHNGSVWGERARIDSSGNFLFNQTTTGYVNTNGSYIANQAYVQNHASGTASGAAYVAFGYNATGIGSITQSGTTAVLYNVTSDQRLKENIQDADSASSLIDSLQVRKFDWKTDQTHQRYGFIAQELVNVAPEAVHQPIDAEEMMAVDYSKLVPMLVKEIQSLRARVAQLETN
jgi:hypothetical protein